MDGSFRSFLLIIHIQIQYIIADIGILAKSFSGKKVFLSSAVGYQRTEGFRGGAALQQVREYKKEFTLLWGELGPQ